MRYMGEPKSGAYAKMPQVVKGKGLTVRLSPSQKELLRQAARLESARQGHKVTAGELLRSGGLRRARSIVRRAQADAKTASAATR